MRKVAVLFGGKSCENEISVLTGVFVLNLIDREKFIPVPVYIHTDGGMYTSPKMTDLNIFKKRDFSSFERIFFDGGTMYVFNGAKTKAKNKGKIDAALNCCHGGLGEGGGVSALMQMNEIPLASPELTASGMFMDKTLTKLVADRAGIRQAAWRLVTARELANNPEAVLDGVEKAFSYPMFIKPAGTGSSVGVSKAKNREALLAALTNASKYDSKILVEEFINGREVEVAVLGNAGPAASVCGEIDSGTEFYDYDAKYISDCAQLYIPARIPEEVSERVRDNAIRIYEAMGCRGLSRVDFFVKSDGEVVFNEINTIPGFTSISMYPKLFEASGIPYSDLLDDLIALALEA